MLLQPRQEAIQYMSGVSLSSFLHLVIGYCWECVGFRKTIYSRRNSGFVNWLWAQQCVEVCVFNECVCSPCSWSWMCFQCLYCRKNGSLHLIALLDPSLDLSVHVDIVTTMAPVSKHCNIVHKQSHVNTYSSVGKCVHPLSYCAICCAFFDASWESDFISYILWIYIIHFHSFSDKTTVFPC